MSIALIVSSFIAGILTILAPCVLPLLPIIIGSSAGSKNSKKPFIVTISLGVSIIIFSLILKASTLLIDVTQSFWNILSGGIVFVFGIFLLMPNLWGWISLKLKFDQSSHKFLENASNKESLFGSVMIGAALGPVFSSCSPTYFVILATILPASFIMGTFYLVIYAFGLMFMLGLIGYLGQKIVIKMKWASNPNGFFKRLMGCLLILTGLIVMTGYVKYIEAKILDTGYDASRLEQKLLENIDDSNETMAAEINGLEQYQDYAQKAVVQAQENNNHYAFFFHADWCSTCKTVEKDILLHIESLPDKSVIFKVDFDTANQIKKDFNVLTQTTFIFFDPKGNIIDRKFNPSIERIVQSLSGNVNQAIKPSYNSNTTSSMKAIKNKKETFGSSKEYFEFLTKNPSLKQATFAGGCFWCIEGPFEAEDGVVEAFSGYSGGNIKNPSYEQVSGGRTGAREAITVFYNPEIISYQTLLEIYWRQIDPSDADGQFADRGTHYTTAVFYHDDSQKQAAEKSKQELEKSGKFPKIATIIAAFKSFYLAEEYHQDYYKKSSDHYKKYKSGSGRERNIEKNSKTFDKIFNDASKHSYAKPDVGKIKSILSDESYAVTQEGATERPFTNRYWDNKEPGIYVDVVTGEPLFSSTDKFDSGTGWPSFAKPIDDNFVMQKSDNKLSVTRTEVKSKMGNSHLGHVFNDGPKDKGGMRYCINSAALRFVPLNKMKQEGYEKYLSLFNAHKP